MSSTEKSIDRLLIRFGDYFSVCMPRYKRLSDLKRNEAVYIPSNYLLSDNIYSYINNPHCTHIPVDVIDEILVVEMQKYDAMIDINGNLFDWSSESSVFSPLENEDCQLYWYDKKLSAVNNVLFNDIIDVEASVIYNLIEINPRTDQVSLDYIRFYFWKTSYCTHEVDCKECKFNTGETCAIMPLGMRALENAYDLSHNLILKECGEERFIICCEIFDDLMIEIHDISQHEELIKTHNIYLSEQSRAFGKKQLQERFGSPLYNELTILEAKIYKCLSPDEKQHELGSYTGFVRSLEEAMTIFNSLKLSSSKGISQASLMAFKSSCEIILKAKLRQLNMDGWKSKNTFYDNIQFVLTNKWKVFNRWLSPEELSDFHDSLHEIRLWKNKGSHTSEFISIDNAERMIDKACNKVIRGIIDYVR